MQVIIDGAEHAAEPVAAKSPEDAASIFCQKVIYNEDEISKCSAGVGAALRHRCEAAYGNTSVEVSLDGVPERVPAVPSPELDPTTQALKWCAGHGLLGDDESHIGAGGWRPLPTGSCAAELSERLWAALLEEHRGRLVSSQDSSFIFFSSFILFFSFSFYLVVTLPHSSWSS